MAKAVRLGRQDRGGLFGPKSHSAGSSIRDKDGSTAVTIRTQHAAVLVDAYATDPHRFRRPSPPPRLPKAAWINEPTEEENQEEPAA